MSSRALTTANRQRGSGPALIMINIPLLVAGVLLVAAGLFCLFLGSTWPAPLRCDDDAFVSVEAGHGR